MGRLGLNPPTAVDISDARENVQAGRLPLCSPCDKACQQGGQLPLQRRIHLCQRHISAKCGKAGDRLGKAAGDDPVEIIQIRIDVQRHAMERDPTLNPDADRSDLGGSELRIWL